MILRMLETGPLQVNCYIVGDEGTRDAMVFDPGGDAERILMQLAKDRLVVRSIVNTHTHWDHTGGNEALQRATGAPILVHPDEVGAQGCSRPADAAAELSANTRFIREGDELQAGSISISVIDLRGHSPGGLGFVFKGRLNLDGKLEERWCVICGDALFAGSIGRTDFPGGNMELLLQNIRSKVFTLPDDTLVLPGHGPISTVGHEKRHNPFF